MTDADDVVGDCFDWCGGGAGWDTLDEKKTPIPNLQLLSRKRMLSYIYIYIDLGPRYSVRRKVPKSPDN